VAKKKKRHTEVGSEGALLGCFVILGILFFIGLFLLRPIACCPQRHTACTVTHQPSGAVWYLNGPPIGHPQNPTIGIPGQWAGGYYHFRSAGTAQDRRFEGVMKSPGIVSVPKHESIIAFED
jgi:hypothetical protein